VGKMLAKTKQTKSLADYYEEMISPIIKTPTHATLMIAGISSLSKPLKYFTLHTS